MTDKKDTESQTKKDCKDITVLLKTYKNATFKKIYLTQQNSDTFCTPSFKLGTPCVADSKEYYLWLKGTRPLVLFIVNHIWATEREKKRKREREREISVLHLRLFSMERPFLITFYLCIAVKLAQTKLVLSNWNDVKWILVAHPKQEREGEREVIVNIFNWTLVLQNIIAALWSWSSKLNHSNHSSNQLQRADSQPSKNQVFFFHSFHWVLVDIKGAAPSMGLVFQLSGESTC